MAMLKIKKGDTVKVIAGRDKDKEGKVIAINRKKNTLLVEGVNMITKHTKPSMQNQQGGIIHRKGQFIFPMSCICIKDSRQESDLSLTETRKSVLQNPLVISLTKHGIEGRRSKSEQIKRPVYE